MPPIMIRKWPGEADDKCCWCFPIHIGVHLIGIGFVLSAVQYVSWALTLLSVSGGLIYGILFGVAAVPLVLAAFLYISFLRDRDNSEKRAGMVNGNYLALLAQVIGVVVYVVEMVTGYATFAVVMNSIINVAINAIFFLYNAGVCERYREQS